jgi:hypothetical protein
MLGHRLMPEGDGGRSGVRRGLSSCVEPSSALRLDARIAEHDTHAELKWIAETHRD